METSAETVTRKRFGRFVNFVAKNYVELALVVQIRTYATLAGEDKGFGTYLVQV